MTSSIQGPQALPGARWQFARASNNLGTLFLGQRRAEASEPLKRARDLLTTLTAEFPTIAAYSQELAAIDYNLGLMAVSSGDRVQAAASFQEAIRLLETLLKRSPDTSTFRLKLAMTNLALGDLLAKTAPADAEKALRGALQEASAVMAKNPEVAEYQSIVGRGHYLLARLLVEKSQPTYNAAEAVRQAEQAQILHEKVLRSRPDSEVDKRALADDRGVLANALIDAGRLSDAAETAARITKDLPDDPAAYLHGAALLIKCADASPTTSGGPRDDFLAHAVGILREAVRSHLIRSPATLDLPDLRLLRDRDDFKTLRDSLAPPRSG